MQKVGLFMKKELGWTIITNISIILVFYIATYLIFRFVFDVRGIYPIYTPGWTGRHFLLYAAVTSIVPMLFGWLKFPYITFTGFLLGNLFGEVFGGFQSHLPPQFLHFGWLICIMVFLVSCIVGVFFELRLKKRKVKL